MAGERVAWRDLACPYAVPDQPLGGTPGRLRRRPRRSVHHERDPDAHRVYARRVRPVPTPSPTLVDPPVLVDQPVVPDARPSLRADVVLLDRPDVDRHAFQ